MTTYIFDIETNGFLDVLDRVHCIVLKDVETGEVHSFADQDGYRPITEALDLLASADMIVGHNSIKFDVPSIKKVYPTWKTKAVVRDSLLMSRLLWPEMREADTQPVTRAKRIRSGLSPMPKAMLGKHSLEAWGHRLGEYKGDYKGPWDTWSPAMQTYCEQDVEVTANLWDRITRRNYAEGAVQMEHAFAAIMFEQEQAGFKFDRARAIALYTDLSKMAREIEVEVQQTFRPWWAPAGVMTPKRDNANLGYTEGAPMTKVKLVVFNPGSRDHIADRLTKLRGWKPTKFTPGAKAKVDEKVLELLPYPEAKVLMRYLTVAKRLGQIGEGNQAWLKKERNGRIHGSINTVGAVTRRCTHSDPNMGQVPKVLSDKEGNILMGEAGGWGHECRSCFTVDDGWALVGADASGLELRCLAHYMARYDGGEYAKVLLEGDIHTVNMEAAGLDSRDQAKTFIYAFLYGAGDAKIGSIVGGGAKRGKQLKTSFLNKTPALKRLKADVAKMVDRKGSLKAIDGGRLVVRHKHAALNTLLQSAGSIAVKNATVLFCRDLSTRGLEWHRDFAIVAHVHDEFQTQCLEEHVDAVKVCAVQSFRDAGELLGFRLPLDGEAKVGRTWATTH